MCTPSQYRAVGVAVVSLLVVGLLVVFCRQYPEWEQWADAQKEGERLEEYGRFTNERNEFNYHLVADLAAGRVAFGHATELLIRANADRPGYLEMVQTYYPAPSLEESAARNLLHRIEWLARTTASVQSDTLPRLKDEYASMFGRRPPPDPDADQLPPPYESGRGGGALSRSIP
ncbi:MAG: hypothetical protein JWO38_3260 [Gemmataceae bacterium]|nr:hypothetical protein [Gemmataceae bacterium]